jgi:hypothetical protein
VEETHILFGIFTKQIKATIKCFHFFLNIIYLISVLLILIFTTLTNNTSELIFLSPFVLLICIYFILFYIIYYCRSRIE